MPAVSHIDHFLWSICASDEYKTKSCYEVAKFRLLVWSHYVAGHWRELWDLYGRNELTEDGATTGGIPVCTASRCCCLNSTASISIRHWFTSDRCKTVGHQRLYEAAAGRTISLHSLPDIDAGRRLQHLTALAICSIQFRKCRAADYVSVVLARLVGLCELRVHAENTMS